MARSRSDLSALLHGFCENVYFQPPTGTKLNYPCIIYNLNKINVLHADNDPYHVHDKYDVTYITRDPDDPNIHNLAMIHLCSFDRSYASDNLHHYAYSLYY